MQSTPKKTRGFRAIDTGTGATMKGLYHGTRPAQAALKAFNRHCRAAQLEGGKKRITIEEVGRPKQYHYIGLREKLEQPKQIVLKSGKEYTIFYKNVVHKVQN